MAPMSRRTFLASGSTALLASRLAYAASRTRDIRSDSGSAGEGLLAGATRIDVTPDPGQPMWGYQNPEQIATGTRDPLYCRALVLRVGETAIGLVSLDMGRVPEIGLCNRVREAVRTLGIDDVIFTATHTHSGPYLELPDLPHLPRIETAMMAGLKTALDKAEPIDLQLARTTIDIAHNRRVIKDGVCYMMWRNEERKPTSPHSAKPVATLVHYACHPVIYASDNRKYSADWPGVMCEAVRTATQGECFFLQGGAGDINPYLDKTPIDAGAEQAVAEEGARAAKGVLSGLAEVRTIPGASIRYREEPVVVGTRWDLSAPSQTAILEESYGLMYEKYMAGLPADFAVPLGVLTLNGEVALAFMPGELFVDFQLDLKRRSPLPDTFLCGYANAFHLYFPTVRDITYGGYGAATVSYVGVGAGERLVTRTTSLIGEMTGAIGPLRGPEDFIVHEL